MCHLGGGGGGGGRGGVLDSIFVFRTSQYFPASRINDVRGVSVILLFREILQKAGFKVNRATALIE